MIFTNVPISAFGLFGSLFVSLCGSFWLICSFLFFFFFLLVVKPPTERVSSSSPTKGCLVYLFIFSFLFFFYCCSWLTPPRPKGSFGLVRLIATTRNPARACLFWFGPHRNPYRVLLDLLIFQPKGAFGLHIFLLKMDV